MGTIGYTYGSEWHLLRYLGYHRDELNRRIEDLFRNDLKTRNEENVRSHEVTVTKWLDFHFLWEPVANLLPPVILEPRILDAERTGIDFLLPDLPPNVPPEWQVFFPPGGGGAGPQNWDAVGRVKIDGEEYWLIVEAKGNLRELRSRCQAGGQSFALIQQAFEQVKAGWNEVPVLNWLDRYYQFCNRVAALHFLRKNSIKAKLLFVYFLGDRHPRGRMQCPENEDGWSASIQQMEDHIGWPNADNPLAKDVHKLFLPVCPPGLA